MTAPASDDHPHPAERQRRRFIRRRKEEGRLHRRFVRLEGLLPGGFGRGMRGLRRPDRAILRIPVAVLLIVGGLLGFLPVLGFWMLPLGLLLLAVDLPFLKAPVARTLVRVEHWWRSRRRGRSD